MTQITESIEGEILIYDYLNKTWTEIAKLDDSNVVSASAKRQCCQDGAFEIGGVYGASLMLAARLTDITRNQLRSSKIVLRSKYAEEDDWEPVGEFWVTRIRAAGDVFTITAEDGMLWTDTDHGEKLIAALLDGYTDAPLDGLMNDHHLTRLSGDVIPAIRSGMNDVLHWAGFDEGTNGSYGNEYLFEKAPGGSEDAWSWVPTAQTATVKPCMDSSGSKSGCCRDFYRWAAELAGGFITIGRDGAMCLRQFGMESLGTAEVSTGDIEWGSADICDFQLWLQSVELIPEVRIPEGGSVSSVQFGMKDAGEIYDFDYRNHAALQYKIENNPLLDGLCERWIVQEQVLDDAKPLAASLWATFFAGGRNRDRVMQIRPFRATVHKAARFELGQSIVLHYRDMHESEETTYESVITSVEWTFRGGHRIACGGENARAAGGRMITKSDRISRELLYRTR